MLKLFLGQICSMCSPFKGRHKDSAALLIVQKENNNSLRSIVDVCNVEIFFLFEKCLKVCSKECVAQADSVRFNDHFGSFKAPV